VRLDDATRLAYVELLRDERANSAIAFLERAVRLFRRHGIRVERLLTDNGSAHRSTIHAVACRIRTLLSGWACGAIYRSSSERAAAPNGWLWHYNHERRHGALNRQTPTARLTELHQNNLLGSYS
jgi:transposase InsO family protein